MTTFYVQWDIEVDAADPQEAAEIARSIQMDPDSLATVFTVTPGDYEAEAEHGAKANWVVDLGADTREA